jgi:hypothetical protein
MSSSLRRVRRPRRIKSYDGESMTEMHLKTLADMTFMRVASFEKLVRGSRRVAGEETQAGLHELQDQEDRATQGQRLVLRALEGGPN